MLKNKKVLISALVLALAFAGAGYYVYSKDQQQKEAQQTDQQKLQEEEKEAGERDPKTESEAYQRQQSSSTSSGTSGTSSSNGSANPTITQLGQSGDSIFVNAIVDGQKSGTCTLEATKAGSATVIRTAQLGLVTSYYACQGFNVERSAFGSAGNWNVVVKFSNGSASGTSESRSLTIQ